MRDDDNGTATARLLGQDLQHRARRTGVQPSSGFIHQQQFGFPRQ